MDADALVLDLLAAGVQPEDSDWRLADDLEARGVRVLRVWVSAPKQAVLQRLADRTTARRVPVSAQEASWIYDQATLQAAGRRLDARIATGEPPPGSQDVGPPLIADLEASPQGSS